jgi:chromosome segregation ATPase
MKVVIPWVCVFALLVVGFFLYATAKEAEKEVVQLHQNDGELTRLQGENVELKQLKVDRDELVRLRNEHEELLRLRGESGQLRKQVKQLEGQLHTAQAQNNAAMQQQHQATDLTTENKALRTQFEQLQAEKARDHAEKCVKNLMLIDGVRAIWANENKKPAGSVATAADLAPYCPNNTFPVCPDGGTYTINALGFAPTCSVPGHALPRQ